MQDIDNKIAFQVRYQKGYEKALNLLKEQGFKYVAIAFGDLDYLLEGDFNKKIALLSTQLKELNLKCVFTHSPYYDLLISAENFDEKMDKGQRLSIKATKLLGADIIAFHPRSYIRNGVVDNEKSLQQNKKDLIRLVEYANSLGVKIALENLCTFSDHEEKFYPQTSCDLIKLVNCFSNVCAVWDFGHAHLNGNDQVKDVLNLKELLLATHVHSNNLDNDYHLLPFDGTTSWQGIINALKEINYIGYLTLEVNYDIETITKEFVKKAYDQVSLLYKMLKSKVKD